MANIKTAQHSKRDIFVREKYDYAHLEARRKAYGGGADGDKAADRFLAEQHVMLQNVATMNGQKAALPLDGTGLQPKMHTAAAGDSAGGIGYVYNNLMAIRSRFEEVLYLGYRLPEFVPIAGDVPAGAKSYGYRIIDGEGRARFIDTAGTDAPNVSVKERIESHTLHYGGIDASWNVQELREAEFGGFPLSTAKVDRAAKACMEHLERVGIEGDTDIDAKGLVNQATTGAGAVSRTSVAKKWHATSDQATDENVFDDVTRAVETLISDSKGILGLVIQAQMCLILPFKQHGRLSRPRIASQNDTRSLADLLRTGTQWTELTRSPLVVQAMPNLSGKGSGNTDRAILCIRDMMVYEQAVSIQPRSMNIYEEKRGVTVPFEYATAPLVVKRPDGLRYLDVI